MTATKIKECFKIINNLSKTYQKGSEIANKCNMKPERVRHLIAFIRRNMVSKFQNPSGKYFIVANRYGYKLSNNDNELKSYQKYLKTRLSYIEQQLVEIRTAIWNKKNIK